MEARTLSWWRSRKAKIDDSPSYQRKGRRWSTSDKQYLIDSILNGFDVPKLYLADFTWGNSTLNEKKKEYAIIDGKQRFEAIFDFFEDNLALDPEFKLMADPSAHLASLTYSELKKEHPEICEVFDNFNLDVMSVITNDKSLIEELFLRLNRSKPLSGAEIRNAISGNNSEAIRKISEHEFFQSNIRFSTTKGQDLNCAAKILLFESSDSPQDTKKTTLDKFTRSTSTPIKIHLREVLSVLDAMSGIFKYKDSLLKSEGQVPAYYWLFRQSSEAAVASLRDFIEEFDQALRSDDKRWKFNLGVLSEYRSASRSINDKSSQERRCEILLEESRKWLRRRGIDS